jgi:hypothetical protein
MLNKSFTLIETIFAIFILTVGIFALFSAINYFFSISIDSRDYLTAVYLAQEGLEIVRNKRDTNIIKLKKGEPITWDDGLYDGNFEVDYTTTTFRSYFGRLLRYDSNLGFNYVSGDQTKFRRRINISEIRRGLTKIGLRVTSQVSWPGKFKWNSFSVQEILYNFLP